MKAISPPGVANLKWTSLLFSTSLAGIDAVSPVICAVTHVAFIGVASCELLPLQATVLKVMKINSVPMTIFLCNSCLLPSKIKPA
jgi:hypothetical protein